MARKGLLKTVQFTDDLSNRFQGYVKDAVDTLTADDDVFSSPVLTLQVSGPIAPGRSVVAYQGPPGANLTLPVASSQGASTALVVMFANKSAGAVTLQPTPPNTINGTTSLSVAAGALVVLLSDGQSRWLALSAGGSGITQLTGDVTAGPGSGSVVATLANIPSGTPAAGTIVFAKVVAPGAVAAGKIAVYADSTSGNVTGKDQFGTISVQAIPDAGTASQWVRSLSAAGVLGKSQPAFTDISGTAALAQIPPVVIAVQRITAGGTYTATAGTKTQTVELWGGGGGGSGAVTGTTGTAAAVGVGGGAGAYARRRYAIAGGGTGTVVIGAAGAAGANTGAIAGAGGASTFTDGTTLLTAPGGIAGPASAAAAATVLVTLGAAKTAAATNGDINGQGSAGGPGTRLSATVAVSGRGGETSLGGAGQEVVTNASGNAGTTNSGSGGSGGVSLTTASPQTGGSGGTGFCLITEYA